MKKLTVVILLSLGVAVLGGIIIRIFPPGDEPIVVVHWTNGHLLRTGSGLRLLDQMSADFNKAAYRTQSGKRIEVQVLYMARRARPRTFSPGCPLALPWTGNCRTQPLLPLLLLTG